MSFNVKWFLIFFKGIEDRLSYRNKLIIQYLLNHGQTTSKELGEVLSVTDRTIKSDMLAIKSVIEKYGADLISTRGKGYEIVIHDSVSFGVIRNVLNREMTMLIPKTSQERILYLVRKLLMVDFEISIQELAEELYVDRSTLNLDMKDVRKIFDNYSLQVESSNKGLLLVGSEIQKRRCIWISFSKIRRMMYLRWMEMKIRIQRRMRRKCAIFVRLY